MSCKNCEEVQDKNDIAYVRVQAANVGLIGCDVHVGHILSLLGAYRQEHPTGIAIWPRQVVRVLGKSKKV